MLSGLRFQPSFSGQEVSGQEVLRACGNAAEKICFCNVNQNGDMAIISYYIDIIDKICIFFRLMGVTAVLGGGFKPFCFHPEPWGNDPI